MPQRVHSVRSTGWAANWRAALCEHHFLFMLSCCIDCLSALLGGWNVNWKCHSLNLSLQLAGLVASYSQSRPHSASSSRLLLSSFSLPLSPKLLGKEGFLHSFGWREMWKVSSPSPPPTHEILHTFLFPLEEWHLDEWRQRCFEMRLWFSVKSRRQFISFTS